MAFKKGEGGRPRGVGNKFPRATKERVKALLEKFGEDVKLIESTLRRGLEARPPASFPYLKLIVEQNAGMPDQDVNLRTIVEHIYQNAEGRS